MYFTDRAQAGHQLAELLAAYRYENCVVVALSTDSVLVAEPIAEALHCIATLFPTEDILLPGEPDPLGSINQEGGFSYNQDLSSGQIEEYTSEFMGYIEGQKLTQFHKINQLLGEGGVVDKDLLRDHVIIVVSDGLKNGTPLDALADFLKPIRLLRMVVVAPLASVKAVDRMHVLADELHVLHVTDNYLDTSHYYDNNVLPSRKEAIAKINQIILNWQ